MKKFVLIALASACFMAGAFSAQAQDPTEEFDLAKLSCADFIKNQEDLVNTMFWLDGYASAQADNTIVSQAWMQEFTTHMVQYCSANPAKTIMDGLDAME